LEKALEDIERKIDDIYEKKRKYIEDLKKQN